MAYGDVVFAIEDKKLLEEVDKHFTEVAAHRQTIVELSRRSQAVSNIAWSLVEEYGKSKGLPLNKKRIHSIKLSTGEVIDGGRNYFDTYAYDFEKDLLEGKTVIIEPKPTDKPTE